MIANKKQRVLDSAKRQGKVVGHIPNVKESNLLRKLMAENKLSKEEVLAIKKYRILLADEQKMKGSKTRAERCVIRYRKTITKALKLPKEHPDVISAVNKYFNNPSNRIWSLWNYSYNGKL